MSGAALEETLDRICPSRLYPCVRVDTTDDVAGRGVEARVPGVYDALAGLEDISDFVVLLGELLDDRCSTIRRVVVDNQNLIDFRLGQ